ncbi:UNVERIFIED_CONTAM: hypothetical protein FKN15_008106 [Acipenser sinensis]
MSGLSRALCSNSMRPIFIALSGLLVASSVSADPVVNGIVGESVVLSAGLSPQDNPSLLVASLSADPVVNGIVGESVVLPAGLSPQDNPSEVEWGWGEKSIALSDEHVSTEQFRDRLHLNRRDWSLTINLLRAEDSGEYKRVATAASEKIESEVTRKQSTETCRATLHCTTNQREHVSYRWKRGDQDLPEHSGILEVSLSPGEINVTFTCVASNPASKATASIQESCDGIAFVAESPGGVSFCVLKSVLLSVGLVLMISAVIGVHRGATVLEFLSSLRIVATEMQIVICLRCVWPILVHLPLNVLEFLYLEKIESEVMRKPSNETCRSTLLCTTNQREHVSYRWKRGGQDLPEHAGILEVSLSPGEINVIFTCIASNPVSEATASIWESCAENPVSLSSDTAHWQIYAGTAGILLLVVLISIVITVAMRKKKKRSEGTCSESNPIDRYGIDGESFHLDVEEYNNLTFKRFVWRKNSKIIMEYNLKTQDVDYYKNEEKLEFDKKTFSLLIKNLENTDSGLYRAETVNDDGGAIHVVTYNLSVQAPVSKPVITNTSDPEGECNSTLKCTVENGTEHSITWLGNGINSTMTHRRSSELCLDNITCNSWPLTCYTENKSMTTEYDVVRPERMNRPTDLPPEITTIYATVRKTSVKNIC